MKRASASARSPITSQAALPHPRASPAAAARAAISFASVPAIERIGASELLSSWPSTRSRRCQARRSSSRSARLRSVITSRSCGRPPSRKRARRTSQRPLPPGNARSTMRASPMPRQSPRPSVVARSGRRAAAKCAPSRRSAAGLASLQAAVGHRTRAPRCRARAMTLASSALFSSTVRRCSRSVCDSALISEHDLADRIAAPRARAAQAVVALAQRFEQVRQACTADTRRGGATRDASPSVTARPRPRSPARARHRSRREISSAASSEQRRRRGEQRAGERCAFRSSSGRSRRACCDGV